MDTQENPQYNRDTCYLCDDGHTELLETHHIVPNRYGGSDHPENLVSLCPTCHRKLERLYGKRFYSALGVEGPAEQVQYISGAMVYQLRGFEEDLRNLISRIEREWTGRTIDLYEDSAKELLMNEVELEAGEDVDIITAGGDGSTTGSGSVEDYTKKFESVVDAVKRVEGYHEKGAPIDSVIELLERDGFSEREARHELDKMKQKGEAYVPNEGHVRTTL